MAAVSLIQKSVAVALSPGTYNPNQLTLSTRKIAPSSPQSVIAPEASPEKRFQKS